MSVVSSASLTTPLDDRDLLCPIPTHVLLEHLLPWLDRGDWRSLRLVNKHFSELYKFTTCSLHVRVCREALQTLNATREGVHAAECTAALRGDAFGLKLRYPSVSQVSICCEPRPLTPLLQRDAVAELVRLLGRRPAQTQLTVRDAHLHPVFGGDATALACRPGDGSGRRGPAAGDAGTRRSHSDSGADKHDDNDDDVVVGGDAGGDDEADPLSAVTAVADAIAAVLPNLTEIRFTGSTAPTPTPTGTTSRTDAAAAGGGGGCGSRNGRNSHGDSSTVSGGILLAPQALLQRLASVLSQPVGTGGGGSGGGGGAAAAVSAGLQALCVDYSESSADAFEAELLDHHHPCLPLLLLDFRAAVVAAAAAAAAAAASGSGGRGSSRSGGGGGGGFAAALNAAIAKHPLLHHPAMQRPAPAPAAPLLRLACLELRGVAVQPGLLAGLRELTALTRLVLSVSCPRPYEPLVTSLPYLKRLTHLHLFLHVPAAAAARQLAGSCRGAGRRGGGGGGSSGCGGIALQGFDGTPDCTAVQLAAAVSQCGNLVSLGLPGEDVGGQMPAVLQALPGLTHLAARQLGAWELAAPHTALRSLCLTMTWPAYLAPLLASLPRLDTLTADVYVHTATAAGGGRRRGRGGAGGGEDAAAAEQLYDELQAVVSGLRDVRHVELQLSVMRSEVWEWGRVVRLLARLRSLRGLTLRMPQADSGPTLRVQDFAGLCRQLNGLRRLTLLLAHPSCSKLTAKALQALRDLPYLELLQLHLSGAWEGHRAADHDEGNVPTSGRAGGGGGGSDGGAKGGGGGGGGGGRNNRSRFRSAATQSSAVDAAATGRGRRHGGRSSGKHDDRDCEDTAVVVTTRQGTPGRSGGAAEGRPGASGPGGGGGGEGGCSSAATLAPPRAPPPLPGGAAALAVLEAARGLRRRRHREVQRGLRKGPRRPRRGYDREDAADDASDSAGDDDDGRGGGGDSAGELSDGDDDCGEIDARHSNTDSQPGGGDGDGENGGGDGSGAGGHGGGGGGGGSALTAAAAAATTAAAHAPAPVELQVDFLTARQAAEVNAVLRWEGTAAAAVVRAGLRPRWVWGEFADRTTGPQMQLWREAFDL